MFIRRLARSIERAAIRRRVRYWAEMLELLDQQARTHAGNVQIAQSECALAKRELAMLDGPPVRISNAPARAPVDGVARFTLLQDSPRERTPLVRKRELEQWAGDRK